MADQNLIRKLRLERFSRRLVLNRPDTVTELDSLAFDERPDLSQGPYDLVLAFVFSLADMEKTIHQIDDARQIGEEGLLYLVYPKKGNKVYSAYIGRDDIFPYLHVSEATGLVEGTRFKFNSMAAFNETFTVTGLKVLGAKAMDSAKAGRESQSVSQYVDQIPLLEQELAVRPDVLAFFHTLTPGYQRDWARYVYSAKTTATVEKRLLEAIDILSQGFKSVTLYHQDRRLF